MSREHIYLKRAKILIWSVIICVYRIDIGKNPEDSFHSAQHK